MLARSLPPSLPTRGRKTKEGGGVVKAHVPHHHATASRLPQHSCKQCWQLSTKQTSQAVFRTRMGSHLCRPVPGHFFGPHRQPLIGPPPVLLRSTQTYPSSVCDP
eukprot:350687-Chlamydomonas_euryale.AAC.2